MLSDRETALTTALRMLRNECHAIRAMSYDAIKDTAGYTNLKVWISRIEEADTLLAKAAGADPVPVCQWREIVAEVERATKKFPTWPTDPLHALAVLGEEFGELTKAVVQQTYEPHKNAPGELRKEAIQTAAMALRFVLSLDAYQPAPSVQHEQALVPAEEEK